MASIDLIKASNGAGDAVQATVTSARVIGATTLKVNDVTNFPTGQFIGTTGTITGTGVFDPATLTVFTAHLSGADVEIDNIAPGYADLGNTNGQVLVIKPNTLWADNVADTLAVSHNQDGTLKNNIVTTAKIANASVTADKIDFTTFPVLTGTLTLDVNPGWATVATVDVSAFPVGAKLEVFTQAYVNPIGLSTYGIRIGGDGGQGLAQGTDGNWVTVQSTKIITRSASTVIIEGLGNWSGVSAANKGGTYIIKRIA